MKYFVMSDVHSFYQPMKKALGEAGFDENNEEHMLILCGDAFDRGPDTIEMFEFLKDMTARHKLIYIRGNHEDLLIKAIHRRYFSSADYYNGTVRTITDLAHMVTSLVTEESGESTRCDYAYQSDIISFIEENSVDYFETANYIFTHGFIPVRTDDYGVMHYIRAWRDAPQDAWRDARWLNGMEVVMERKIRPEKTVVVGHIHSSYGNLRQKYGWNPARIQKLTYDDEFKDFSLMRPFYGRRIIAIDSCTFWTQKVNVLVIEDDLY